MNILLKRFSYNDNGTNGILLIDGKFECFTAEPTEKRIPCDTYEIDYNENLSPMTQKYMKKYMWFKKHIQLHNVFNRNWIYIHVGNDPVKDSKGCILVGNRFVKNPNGLIGDSRNAFKELYMKITNTLEENDPVYITIEDTWND
jgi:hypothetical protein